MDPHADPAGLPEGAPAPFSLKPETAPTVASPIAPDAIRKVRRTWVPVRSLTSRHRARIRAHLLGLDEHDRYLRFGFAASDAQISHYADALDFERDELFGIFNRRLDLIAMAHLAYPPAQAVPGKPALASSVRNCVSQASGSLPLAALSNTSAITLPCCSR